VNEIGVLADQQAALHRVATLVARAVAPSEVFAAVARELASCLGMPHADALPLRARWLGHPGRCPRRERESDPAGRHATLVRR